MFPKDEVHRLLTLSLCLSPQIVLGRSEVWEARDTEVHLSVSSFLAAAICRLKGEADKSLPYLLPKTVHTLVQQLGAEQDGVRFAAVGSLRKVLEVRRSLSVSR